MEERGEHGVAVGLAMAMVAPKGYATLSPPPAPYDRRAHTYDNTPKRERNDAIIKAIDDKTATYRELADMYGISYTRVAQIYEKARNHRAESHILNAPPEYRD